MQGVGERGTGGGPHLATSGQGGGLVVWTGGASSSAAASGQREGSWWTGGATSCCCYASHASAPHGVASQVELEVRPVKDLFKNKGAVQEAIRRAASL